MTTNFTPAPKPGRKQRDSEAQEKRAALLDYRRVQSALAIERDGSLCVFCWFLLRKKTPRQDIHHVFGRGDAAGDWRENYRSLLCTCRKHHPLPIQTPGGNEKLAYVEWVLQQANEHPINTRFKHAS